MNDSNGQPFASRAELAAVWRGNRVEVGASTIADGHIIFYRHASRDPKLLKRLDRPQRGYQAASGAMALGKLVGERVHRRHRREPARLIAEGRETWAVGESIAVRVPSDQLELLRLVTGFDVARIDRPMNSLLRVYRGGRLVGGITTLLPAVTLSDAPRFQVSDAGSGGGL